MSDPHTYVNDRIFDAPRELVWRTWTEPDLLSRWYGPGVETIIHRYDLEPGGVWLNEMKWGDKADLSKMVFQEVAPPEKLVWLHSSADAQWNTVANPMMPDCPKTMLTTVTFEPDGSRTKVRLTLVPVEATESELACFAEMLRGMDNGWGKGYTIIDTILTELKATA